MVEISLEDRSNQILFEINRNCDNICWLLPDLRHGYFWTSGSRIVPFDDELR
jgi:hypothetical protein